MFEIRSKEFEEYHTIAERIVIFRASFQKPTEYNEIEVVVNIHQPQIITP